MAEIADARLREFVERLQPWLTASELMGVSLGLAAADYIEDLERQVAELRSTLDAIVTGSMGEGRPQGGNLGELLAASLRRLNDIHELAKRTLDLDRPTT